MATGVPKSNGKSQSEAVRLEYPGKKPVQEILTAPPATLVPLSPTHPHDNRLIFGDNLGVMAALGQDDRVFGKVRLAYIDPPFATQSAFHSRKLAHAYEDTLAGAEFIEFLRERLVWLHHLLAEDGSLYLHLDERMVFRFRIVLDEIFGLTQFRNCITRKKCNPKNYTRNTYGNVADYILFYTKSDHYVWNRAVEPWTDERIAKEYQYVGPEPGRRYKKVPIHAPGVRNGETGKPWRGMMPPPGKHWQYPPSKLDELDAKGEIYWSPTGNPRRKVYLDRTEGVPLQNIWMDVRDAHNQNIRITGYPTEKNHELLRRIILASSNPGDLVMDCFAGSGTTLAVASESNRRWIGVDNSTEAIKTTLCRFAVGTEPMGDYVSAHKQQQKPQMLLLPGFESPQVNRDDHIPIQDFTLYAEADKADTLRVLIAMNKLVSEVVHV
ncbi:MAG: site-specific DNA-methyltransferase [Burkholderiales bacterium]